MSIYSHMNNLEYWCASADDWLRYAKEDQDRMDRAGYLEAKRSWKQAVKNIAFYIKEIEAAAQ